MHGMVSLAISMLMFDGERLQHVSALARETFRNALSPSSVFIGLYVNSVLWKDPRSLSCRRIEPYENKGKDR